MSPVKSPGDLLSGFKSHLRNLMDNDAMIELALRITKESRARMNMYGPEKRAKLEREARAIIAANPCRPTTLAEAQP